MDKKLDFPLLKNGLDFLYSAVKGLCDSPTDSDIKYSILHLCTGIELLFKERLRREHWTLVVDKIDNADRNKYEAGNFNSANFFSCINRLEKTCSVVFNDKQKDFFERLRAKRNRIEHFGLTESREAAIIDVTIGLVFVAEFIQKEIGESSLNPYEGQILRQIKQKLGEFEAYVSSRLSMLSPTLQANHDRIVECPICKQKALVLDIKPNCLFCYSKPSPFLAGGYIENMHSIFWAAAQDEKIVPYIRRLLGDIDNGKERIAAGFPSNAIWTLAHIGNNEALDVLKDYQTRSDHRWIALAIKAISLRKEKGSKDFAILLSDIQVKDCPSYATRTVTILPEGEEIRVLEQRIVNREEQGPRGGPAVFDRIEHVAIGLTGYIRRAGDNFPPFI